MLSVLLSISRCCESSTRSLDSMSTCFLRIFQFSRESSIAVAVVAALLVVILVICPLCKLVRARTPCAIGTSPHKEVRKRPSQRAGWTRGAPPPPGPCSEESSSFLGHFSVSCALFLLLPFFLFSSFHSSHHATAVDSAGTERELTRICILYLIPARIHKISTCFSCSGGRESLLVGDKR